MYSGEILCGGYIEEVIERMYLLVDCHGDLGNQRLLTSSPFLVLYLPSVIPIVEAFCKDTALREQCVVEMIWAGYMAEPQQAL